MSQNLKSRRAFFIQTAKVVGTLAVAPAVLGTLWSQSASAEEKRRGAAPGAAGPVMVDPAKDPVAKGVKYVEDFKKSPESKGNKCATCSLYKKTTTKDSKEVGSCVLFAGKAVYADAWCASWTKKV